MAFTPSDEYEKSVYPSKEKSRKNLILVYRGKNEPSDWFIPDSYVNIMSTLSYVCMTDIIPTNVRGEMAIKACNGMLSGFFKDPNAPSITYQKATGDSKDWKIGEIGDISRFWNETVTKGLSKRVVEKRLRDKGIIRADSTPEQAEAAIKYYIRENANLGKDLSNASVGHRIAMTMIALGFGYDDIDPLFDEMQKRNPNIANSPELRNRMDILKDGIKKSKFHYAMDEMRVEATKFMGRNDEQGKKEYEERRQNEEETSTMAELNDISPFLFDKSEKDGKSFAEIFQENYNQARANAGDIKDTRYVDDINVFVDAINKTSRRYAEEKGHMPKFDNVAFFDYLSRNKHGIDPAFFSVDNSSNQYYVNKNGNKVTGNNRAEDINMKTHGSRATHFHNKMFQKKMDNTGIKSNSISFGANPPADEAEGMGYKMEDNGLSEKSIENLKANQKPNGGME